MLKDYFKAGKQATFDAVVRHLLTQKKKSRGVLINEEGEHEESCLYRSQENLKCAIGALIDDSEYKPEFETLTAFAVARKLIQRADTDYDTYNRATDFGLFLTQLQRVHDGQAPLFWAEELRRFAYIEGLNPAVIEEMEKQQ